MSLPEGQMSNPAPPVFLKRIKSTLQSFRPSYQYARLCLYPQVCQANRRLTWPEPLLGLLADHSIKVQVAKTRILTLGFQVTNGGTARNDTNFYMKRVQNERWRLQGSIEIEQLSNINAHIFSNDSRTRAGTIQEV
ncbi:hypothetical protein WG66_014719 [Moniliophthora roreri]|nr:hypothetical protein WG66_014719 [Moniliophthora roreri]